MEIGKMYCFSFFFFFEVLKLYLVYLFIFLILAAPWGSCSTHPGREPAPPAVEAQSPGVAPLFS